MNSADSLAQHDRDSAFLLSAENNESPRTREAFRALLKRAHHEKPAETLDLIELLVKARQAANIAWVDVEYLKMRASEVQSEEANRRAEMRL